MKEYIQHSGPKCQNLAELRERIDASRDHIQEEFGGEDGVPGAPKRQGAIQRVFKQLPRRADACIQEDGGPILTSKMPRQ